MDPANPEAELAGLSVHVPMSGDASGALVARGVCRSPKTQGESLVEAEGEQIRGARRKDSIGKADVATKDVGRDHAVAELNWLQYARPLFVFFRLFQLVAATSQRMTRWPWPGDVYLYWWPGFDL